MIFGNPVAKMKLVEQLTLVTLQTAIMDRPAAIRLNTTESRFEASLIRLLQQNLPIAEVGPTRSPRRHGQVARAAFAINYDGNPGRDGRPVGPALQV
jgi:hypothetical protein